MKNLLLILFAGALLMFSCKKEPETIKETITVPGDTVFKKCKVTETKSHDKNGTVQSWKKSYYTGNRLDSVLTFNTQGTAVIAFMMYEKLDDTHTKSYMVDLATKQPQNPGYYNLNTLDVYGNIISEVTYSNNVQGNTTLFTYSCE